jgi:hypothetical protein
MEQPITNEEEIRMAIQSPYTKEFYITFLLKHFEGYEESIHRLNYPELQQLYTTWVLVPEHTEAEMLEFIDLTDFMINAYVMNPRYLKYANLYDQALETGSPVFLDLLLNTVINGHMLWYVYIRRNHRLYSRTYNPTATGEDYTPAGNERMECILLDHICGDPEQLNQLCELAINGEREETTYRPRDFYNYVEPSLSMVKKIVPAFISAAEGLRIWEDYYAFTYSMDSTKLHEYPFEKDQTIYEYLREQQ